MFQHFYRHCPISNCNVRLRCR